MTGFKVNIAHLEQVVGDIASFGNALEQSVCRVRGQLGPVYSTWTGAAANNHSAVYEQWQIAAVELRGALETMRRIAATAHGNYTAAAVANKRMWRF